MSVQILNKRGDPVTSVELPGELTDRLFAALEEVEIEGRTEQEVLVDVAKTMARDEPLTSEEFELVGRVLENYFSQVRTEADAEEELSQRILRVARAILRANPEPVMTTDLCEAIEGLVRTRMPLKAIAKELHGLVADGYLVRDGRTSRAGRRYYLWSLPANNDGESGSDA